MSAAFRQTLYSALTGDTTVTEKLGNRMFPIRATEGVAHPYCVYHIMTGSDELLHDGEVGLVDVVMRFDFFGDDLDRTFEARDAVKALLNGRTITNGTTTFWGIQESEHEVGETESRLFHLVLDIEFKQCNG